MNFLPHKIPTHFTASGVVIHQNHLLLVHHKRIGAWVPPGGHIEPDEFPEDAAVREVEEETGLKVEVISRSRPQFNDPDAFFLMQPLFVQSVLAVEKGERLYHIDMAYLCQVRDWNDEGLPPLNANPEVKESRWVALNNLDSVPLAKNVREILQFLDDQIYEIRDTERDFCSKTGLSNNAGLL